MSATHRQRQTKAVQTIESAWCRHRDRQMFRLLKHAVCAAEHALSTDILRRLSPREAELLRDPSMNVKIKFRFGGVEFPPVIYFKIFTRNSNGATPKYLNGKTIINADMNARIAACQQMGQRVFYQQMLTDSLHGVQGRATDEIDVVTTKDYMQYSSLLDELPSYLGGRANNWRRLNLEDIPRHSIFYDIVSYIQSGALTADLRNRLPLLLTQPHAPYVQLQHIHLLKEIKSTDASRSSQASVLSQSKKAQSTARRSRRALDNASKMRRVYITARSESLPTSLVLQLEQEHERAANLLADREVRSQQDNTSAIKDEFDDGEVDALYAWTEQLQWTDDLLQTGRIPSA